MTPGSLTAGGKLHLIAAISAIALTSAAPAWATITIISSPPYPPNPSENVLFNQTQSGATILATTNQTNTSVSFTSTESLVNPPQGQAALLSTDGSLNQLNIALTNSSLGFGQFEFNLDGATTGQVNLTFTDQLGKTFGGVFTVDRSGSNFFDAVASDGELITNVAFTGVNGFGVSDVAQVRLGGVTSIGSVVPAGGVPEAATWAMMVLGFGGIGGLLRAKRRRRPAIA